MVVAPGVVMAAALAMLMVDRRIVVPADEFGDSVTAPNSEEAAINGADRVRVFLSYSRSDSGFMKRLAERLDAHGYAPDFDRFDGEPGNVDRGLAIEDDWWARLKEMIASANIVLFLVSPEFIASRVCEQEVAYARQLGVRAIPVLVRSTDLSRAPPSLAALNVKIDFSGGDADFDPAFEQLVAGLRTDIHWHRQVTSLTRLAQQWDQGNRPSARLLRLQAIEEAEALIARAPASAERPGELLLSYLAAGRRMEAEDRDRLLRTTSRAFVAPALRALEGGSPEAALRIIAAGVVLSHDPEMRLVPRHTRNIVRAASQTRLLAVVRNNGSPVDCMDVSPDGRSAVMGSGDGMVLVRDVMQETGESVLAAHGQPVTLVRFSPDGSRILTIGPGPVAGIHAASDGALLVELAEHDGELLDCSFSPDGRLVGTASSDCTARIWDATTGKTVCLLKGHTDFVNEVRFSVDGRRVVTASSDCTARVWSVDTGRQLSLVRHDRYARSAGFHADGQRILTASDDEMFLSDATNGRILAEFSVTGGRLARASLSPDCSKVLWAGIETLTIFDTETGTELVAHQFDGDTVATARFSPDGMRVAVGCQSGMVRLCSAVSVEDPKVLHGHEAEVTELSFCADGTRLMTCSLDGACRVWDTAVSPLAAVFAVPDARAFCTTIVGNRILAFVGLEDFDTMEIRDVRSGDEIDPAGASGFPLPRDMPNPLRPERVIDRDGGVVLATSPDGRHVLKSYMQESAAFLCDAITGIRSVAIGPSPDVDRAVFNVDGTMIATCSGPIGPALAAVVWDAQTGQQISLLEGHESFVLDVAFSPDGDRVVTASADRTARVWDARTGSELLLLDGHGDEVRRAYFCHGGAEVVTESWDRAARVWDVSRTRALTGDPLQLLTASLTHGRGRKERSDDDELIMEEAPEDLLAPLIGFLSSRDGDATPAVGALSRCLQLPLQTSCYLPRTDIHEPYQEIPASLSEEEIAEMIRPMSGFFAELDQSGMQQTGPKRRKQRK